MCGVNGSFLKVNHKSPLVLVVSSSELEMVESPYEGRALYFPFGFFSKHQPKNLSTPLLNLGNVSPLTSIGFCREDNVLWPIPEEG